MVREFGVRTKIHSGQLMEWRYIEHGNLIAIRREEGVNYIEPTFRSLNSINRVDAQRLSWMEMVDQWKITDHKTQVLIEEFKKENRDRKYVKFSNPGPIQRKVFKDDTGKVIAQKLIYPKLHFEFEIPL